MNTYTVPLLDRSFLRNKSAAAAGSIRSSPASYRDRRDGYANLLDGREEERERERSGDGDGRAARYAEDDDDDDSIHGRGPFDDPYPIITNDADTPSQRLSIDEIGVVRERRGDGDGEGQGDGQGDGDVDSQGKTTTHASIGFFGRWMDRSQRKTAGKRDNSKGAEELGGAGGRGRARGRSASFTPRMEDMDARSPRGKAVKGVFKRSKSNKGKDAIVTDDSKVDTDKADAGDDLVGPTAPHGKEATPNKVKRLSIPGFALKSPLGPPKERPTRAAVGVARGGDERSRIDLKSAPTLSSSLSGRLRQIRLRPDNRARNQKEHTLANTDTPTSLKSEFTTIRSTELGKIPAPASDKRAKKEAHLLWRLLFVSDDETIVPNGVSTLPTVVSKEGADEGSPKDASATKDRRKVDLPRFTSKKDKEKERAKVQKETKKTAKKLRKLKSSLEDPKEAPKIIQELKKLDITFPPDGSATRPPASKPRPIGSDVNGQAPSAIPAHDALGNSHSATSRQPPLKAVCLECGDSEVAGKAHQEHPPEALPSTTSDSTVNELVAVDPKLDETAMLSVTGSDGRERSIDVTDPKEGYGEKQQQQQQQPTTAPGTSLLTSRYRAVENLTTAMSDGGLPTPGKVVGRVLSSTGFFNTLAGMTGRIIEYTGAHDDIVLQPPKDRMSVLIYWWGYELVLPPPSLAYLATANSVASTLFTFLQAMAVTGGAPELAPFIRYLSLYVDMEWKAIHGQDKGKGVVLAATWVVPMAAVPRPYDF